MGVFSQKGFLDRIELSDLDSILDFKIGHGWW